jgi:arsenate reductase (thioredoxin)
MSDMGCGDTCPLFPRNALPRLAARRSRGAAGREVRTIRDEIDRRVQDLVAELRAVP